jgi:hypothetical protein
MTRKWFVDFCERVVVTFVEGFAASWIVTQDWTVNNLKVGLVAGGVSAAKCIVAANVGNRDSASVAPSV